MSTGQILPQGVLAASTMVEGHAGFGGDRTGTRCEPGFFLGPMEVSILWGQGQGLMDQSTSPKGIQLLPPGMAVSNLVEAWLRDSACTSELVPHFPWYAHLGQRLGWAQQGQITLLNQSYSFPSVCSPGHAVIVVAIVELVLLLPECQGPCALPSCSHLQ